MLARRSHPGAHDPATLRMLEMTRDQIANYLGLTLETVSRQFNALKKEGVIDFSGRKRIVVLNYAALQDASGDDADGGVLL